MTEQQQHFLSLVESHIRLCMKYIRRQEPFTAEDHAELALHYLKTATSRKSKLQGEWDRICTPNKTLNSKTTSK